MKLSNEQLDKILETFEDSMDNNEDKVETDLCDLESAVEDAQADAERLVDELRNLVNNLDEPMIDLGPFRKKVLSEARKMLEEFDLGTSPEAPPKSEIELLLEELQIHANAVNEKITELRQLFDNA